MKYNFFIKNKLLVIALSFVIGFSSCNEDDVLVGLADENKYTLDENNYGYLVGGDGSKAIGSFEFREKGVADLYLKLSKEVSQDVNAKVKIDESILQKYNQKNETDYKLFPMELVEFDNSGNFKVDKGKKRSDKIVVRFRTGDALNQETYVIPIAVSSEGGVKQTEESNYLIFVKDFSKIPDCNKSTGIKIISCMEVNDTNPLNNLCFTLKSSGKPLVDIVILFSANINYDLEAGRVYVHNNPNVQHLLNNREKYLKPLQDRGMKIVLGILGNHDRSGVSNLADNTAREFAKELKSVCDTYNLDGIFYDDEYSKYMYPPPAGFVYPSEDAAARLCYETKRAMPDKLVCAYVYGNTGSFHNPVDGAIAGEFVDYGIHDYGGSWDLSDNYPGMPKSGMALYSQEFARGSFASESSLRRMREEGYGAHMIFAMDPFRSNFAYYQMKAMNRVAKELFDDELEYDNKPYKKDWE